MLSNDQNKPAPPKEDELEHDLTAGAAQKRKRYVSRACVECKKRKCSGDEPCESCAASGNKCEYSREPRRRARNMMNGESPGEQVIAFDDTTTFEIDGEKISTRILHHLQSIQAELGCIKERFQDPASLEKLNVLSTSAGFLIPSMPATVDQPEKVAFGNSPSILKPIQILEQQVQNSSKAGEGSDSKPDDSKTQTPSNCLGSMCSDVSDCYINELRLWDANIRHHGLQPMQEAINVYFSLLNPHYPCLDEQRFRQAFERFGTTQHMHEITLDRLHVISLVYLIIAIVRIVKDFCADEKTIPGWYEFTRADHILNHIIRTGKGSLATIQCLILQASYLLYVERQDWAYDVMGIAIRLVFQLDMNKQKAWSNLSPFDIHMKQRVFWCIYCLERNIAHQCGVPYQLSENDIAVDLPSEMEGGTQGFVAESGSITPIPSLVVTIKWARLCSHMWDSMFGVNAQPVTAEFIAITDARIQLLINEVPKPLQWTSDLLQSSDSTRYPHYAMRQSIVLHLRVNHLRLLLRRGDTLDAKSNGQTSSLCVDIATSSIDAMCDYHFSPFKQNTERFPTVSFLSGTIVTLAAVILANRVDRATFQKACESFKKAIKVLEDISPGFSLARRVLHRFQKITHAATQRMTTGQPQAPNADFSQSRYDTPMNYNPALFDFNLEDLVHFENTQLLEDDANLFLLSSMTQPG